jgi:hypothetical protein
VHKGFSVLDTIPHVLTRARILEVDDVHVVMPADVPNPGWLRPGSPSKGQQTFELTSQNDSRSPYDQPQSVHGRDRSSPYSESASSITVRI